MLPAGSFLTDRYEILTLLGAGGMGEVYKTRDHRLGRDVAVKIVPKHLASNPELVARFEREAKALATLSHPNLVTIYDFGSHHGTYFAVMELLQGETLAQALERSRFAWRKVLEVGTAVADGLAAAHSKNVIHRDIKPSNIYFLQTGGIKILDFGLAHVEPATTQPDASMAATASNLTQPGIVMGTIPYMSPEQIRGAVVDARSDIFSLGCVLYEMIAGRNPFRRPTNLEIMSAIVNDSPPLLSNVEKDVPLELDHAIFHCLEKDPDKRFQSARDLAFALQEIATGTLPTRKMQKPRKSSRRDIRSLAVLPLVNASGDSNMDYLSDGITESIINSLSQLKKLRVMARSTVFRFKGSSADPQKIGSDLNVRTVLTGKVVQFGNNLNIQVELVDVEDGAQLWGERYTRKASDIFAIQEEIAREISEKLRLKLSGDERKRLEKRFTHNTEAYALYLKGRYHVNKRTAEDLRRGVDYFQEAIGLDPTYALAYTGMADSYTLLERYGIYPPRDSMPKAKAAAQRALELDDTLGEAHVSLAETLRYYDWDWPGAETEFQRAISLNPAYPTAHHWYSWFLTSQGRFEEALQQIQKAKELDPLSLIINANHGTVLYYSRRYEEASAELKKVVDMDSNFVVAHQWLGRVWEQMGRFEEAILAHKKALNLRSWAAESAASLAHAYAVAGKRQESKKLLNEILERARNNYVSSYWLALIFTGLSEIDLALEWLYKAHEERFDWLAYLKIEPMFDPLRKNPGFINILQLMNL